MHDLEESINPVNILIVDDHPNTANMLARVLSNMEKPVDVVTAASGEDALSKIGNKDVDILITDFMMPGLNGLELIEKINEEQKPAHTILITAYDTPGLSISARRLEVQDYLVKPVQPEKIHDIVRKVLEDLSPTNGARGGKAAKGAKILIADDYPDNLRLLSARLKSEGYVFIAAWDGEETLKKIRSEDPDLVLLDVNMPKKDGFEVLTEMRADPAIAHIPVIIITAARIGPKDVREGLTLGADDYITKPFDWRELAARIQSKLRVKQAEDVLRQRTKELGILPDIGQELGACLDEGELANIVLNRIVDTLDILSARLDVFHQNGQIFSRERLRESDAPESLRTRRDEVLNNALITKVISDREGLIIDDLGSEKEWNAITALDHVIDNHGSALVVPLLGSKGVIGVLTLTHDQPNHFSSDHMALFQAVAGQAAIAIENAQLLDFQHKRVQELVDLNKLIRELNNSTYKRELIDRLPRLLQEAVGYPIVALWSGCGDDEREPDLNSMVGAAQEIDLDILISAPQQITSNGASTFLSEPNEEPSVAAVKLGASDRIFGVLAVYSPEPNSFEENDLVLLETIAMQISAAFERIELFESVEKEQRRLLAVLRSADEAILVIDSQNVITLSNPMGEKLFFDAEATVGNPLPKGKGYGGLIELLDTVRHSKARKQGEVAWPDGRTFSVLGTPIEEGGLVAVLHDISQFKALAELKNEYIATASHDLKNPIQAVMGYNDLLKKAGPLNEMQEEFSHRIHGSARQMRDLVLNLLEISRLESGSAMHEDLIDINLLISDTAKEMEDMVEQRGHKLNVQLCEQQMNLLGDRTLIQQMVNNLLSNAIKYTIQDGEIILSTDVDKNNGIITIKDNGVGIPDEDLPSIFNKFYRVYNDETKDIEGTGLGLAIVKSIVDNHNGTIEVRSEIGVGTSFAVILPVATGVPKT